MDQELVHEEEYKGFKIKLYFLPEYSLPDWDMTDEEKKELNEQIRDGDLLWFCAKATACLDGVEIADDYLGGCCFESVDDFVKNSGYYDDMKDNVISEAKAWLSKNAQKGQE